MDFADPIMYIHVYMCFLYVATCILFIEGINAYKNLVHLLCFMFLLYISIYSIFIFQNYDYLKPEKYRQRLNAKSLTITTRLTNKQIACNYK